MRKLRQTWWLICGPHSLLTLNIYISSYVKMSYLLPVDRKRLQMWVVSCFDSFLAKQNSKISLFWWTTRAPWNREIMEMTQPCYHLYIFNVFLFINFWQTLVSSYWVCALVEWKKIVLIKPPKSRRRKV